MDQLAPLQPVPDAVLDDLRERLRRTRTVPIAAPAPGGDPWARGADPALLAELVRDWIDFDWRAREAEILARPWVSAEVGDRVIRAIHHRREGAPTVVLLHGWPDSFLRFDRAMPLLGDLDVVVPSLPGFAYSGPLAHDGMSTDAMADAVAGLLASLGIDRVTVSAGDVGSGVAERLAHRHPGLVTALHLTDVPFSHLFTLPPDELTDDERDYLARGEAWQRGEGGYQHEQSTKPATLAAALADSPVGLLAWLLEKLHGWSDHGGDVESVFPRDDILTWTTLVWVTGTASSWFTSYVERVDPVPGRIAVPTVVDQFPGDLVGAPRSYAERFFDIRGWTDHDRGGHFAAWERPDVWVAGLRTAIEAGWRAPGTS